MCIQLQYWQANRRLIMKCFICGKKITWSAKGITSDFKGICPDDINKIIIDANANKLSVPLSVAMWIQKKSSDEIKRLLDNDITFTLKEIKSDKVKDNSTVVKAEKQVQSATVESKPKLSCPYCGSTNLQPLGQHRKVFSVGKAVGGTVLTGGVGALAGFIGKKTKQTDFVCMNCGKQFKK